MTETAISVRHVHVPAAVTAAAAGALALLAFVRFGLTGEGVVVAATFAVLIVLSAIDLRERRLPNRIVLPSAAVALAAQSLVFPDRWLEWVVSSLLAALVLLVPAFINPAGIGMGDVKLALLLGAVLGADVVDAVLLGFIAIVPVAVVLFARHGQAARKATLPLGPFLAAGAVLVLLLSGPRDEQPKGTVTIEQSAGAPEDAGTAP